MKVWMSVLFLVFSTSVFAAGGYEIECQFDGHTVHLQKGCSKAVSIQREEWDAFNCEAQVPSARWKKAPLSTKLIISPICSVRLPAAWQLSLKSSSLETFFVDARLDTFDERIQGKCAITPTQCQGVASGGSRGR